MDKQEIIRALRKPWLNEETLTKWDGIRGLLLGGNRGTLPRDVFESIIDAIDEERQLVADWIEAQDPNQE